MNSSESQNPDELAAELAVLFGAFPQVRAVAVGGSRAAGTADAISDIDLYVFLDAPILVADRRELIAARADRAEVDNQFWGPGDEWVERATGIGVDAVYFGGAWMDEQLDRVLGRHEASVGYSTAFLFTILHAQPLYDRDGWFAALQRRAEGPYPEQLRRAIIAHNWPILRRNISSYYHQIEKALGRGDAVSVNHRVAGLLASFFDIIFAVNRLPHPGEKRLLRFVEDRCEKLPPDFEAQLAAVLAFSGSAEPRLLPAIDSLLDGLDSLLRTEGLIE